LAQKLNKYINEKQRMPPNQALALQGNSMKLIELSDKEIITIVKPLAEHTESSWNQKNYDDFCRYLLVKRPGHKFPEEEFNKQIEESYDTYGNHTISDFVALHRNPENVIVIWKVDFENRKEPGLLMYEFEQHEGNMLISGCSYHA